MTFTNRFAEKGSAVPGEIAQIEKKISAGYFDAEGIVINANEAAAYGYWLLTRMNSYDVAAFDKYKQLKDAISRLPNSERSEYHAKLTFIYELVNFSSLNTDSAVKYLQNEAGMSITVKNLEQLKKDAINGVLYTTILNQDSVFWVQPENIAADANRPGSR